MDSSEMKWSPTYRGFNLISRHTDGWRSGTIVHGKVKLRSRCRGCYWISNHPEMYYAIYGGKSRTYKTEEEARAMVLIQVKLGVTL